MLVVLRLSLISCYAIYIHSEVMNKQKKHDDCKEATFADQLFKCCIVARYETGTQRVYSTRLIYSRVYFSHEHNNNKPCCCDTVRNFVLYNRV